MMNATKKKQVVLMWGYLPGTSQQRSPLISPVAVHFPDSVVPGDSWMDVCGGGCGFAMALSETGKLITWGSTDDQGQSYLTSGKHGETPEPFPLPEGALIVKAAAGWAHCISVTEKGEVYTWGWKECVPGKVPQIVVSEGVEGDASTKQSLPLTEQGEPLSHQDNKEVIKKRKISSAKQEAENSVTVEETLSAPLCLVTLDPGVKITSVAAGGRHTLALSDVGQVWGWGYGGEGQLGLGSKIKMVATPHLIPCIVTSSLNGKAAKFIGNRVKRIACGGRHSAVITDTGELLTFGWGSYGQCGHGDTNDMLRPSCVSSLLGTQINEVAAGLWHTLCIANSGRVYAFGGNQFGQLGLGLGSDQVETSPKLLDASILECKIATTVSCGARHSAILTEDSKIFSWGWNKYGQLGVGDIIDRNIPSQVWVSDCVPTNIACGWWHTLLLAESC